MDTPKAYAYLRKSTDGQNTRRHEWAVYEYANAKGLRIDQLVRR